MCGEEAIERALAHSFSALGAGHVPASKGIASLDRHRGSVAGLLSLSDLTLPHNSLLVDVLLQI